MELTRKQEEGLKIALKKFNNHEKYVTIAGYAGTGKSTLVRFIVEALPVKEEDIVFCAYTGKAAEVLRKKGNKNAMTLHKLLYDFRPRPEGGFLRFPKKVLEYKAIIVDEVSMLPSSMLDLLLRYDVFVIFLGDPLQIPQIDKKEKHELLEHADIFLDEIMRQAADSEIIQLTMKIRNGEPIDFTKGKEVQVIPKTELVTGHMEWADIMICATNAMRHGLNMQMRSIKGLTDEIQEGDKVVVKRNYWDICNDDNNALVNGTVGIVKNCFPSFIETPRGRGIPPKTIPIYIMDLIPEVGSTYMNLDVDKNFILKEEPFLDWKTSYKLKRLFKDSFLEPIQLTYGFAITCHCAQGSEWDNVLVIEEDFPFDREEHKRWLYTAATRASQRLVLLR